MIYKILGTAVCASTMLVGGCGILETVEIPQIQFDSNTYVVQPGDTLQSVADRYNIDPQSLSAVNSLNSAQLVPGQKLLLVRTNSQIARSLPADQPVAMIPTDSRDPQFTTVQEGAVPIGSVVVVPPREEIVAVRDPASTTDALLDDQPVVARLPEAPGAVVPVPALENAEVINNDVIAGQTPRPQGTETVIQSVDADNPNMVEIPAAVNNPVTGGVAAVKSVTVNTRANGWNWPALGKITRDFDLSEINRQGLDIDAGPGAGVQAAADGEVVYSGRDLASYGNLVILRHEDNYLSAYSKVSDIFVKENQKVKAGDLIAVVGDAATEGTELHFEIRRNGEPVDPVQYLPAL
jgi:lipoprotein NlpD